MAWKFNSSAPIYLQIASRVMADILCEKYPAGSKIPSVRELGFMAGVNPNTVQHAMAELERQGAVTALMGDGRYVTEDTEVIESLRAKAAREATDEFVRKMLSISVDRASAEILLEEAFKKYTIKED